ncbi:MAG: class I SAM-dependent methyltransferase [Burkholderiales bacterium]|nr:class I SAM-dependent methyltransferase [Burkholderiales bacterium]
MQAHQTVAPAAVPALATEPADLADAAPPSIDIERGRAELRRWLRRLAKVFDLEAVRREPAEAGDVVRYYEQNHAAYRRYHSSEGAVHMALNPEGRFDAAGFAGPLMRIEARWRSRPAPPEDVLELAFGQGYNLAWLVPRHEYVRFQGIDLTPAHVALARARLAAWTYTTTDSTGPMEAAGETDPIVPGDPPAARVRLVQGDFHHLPQADGCIDCAYCIESMCHALDLPRALGEVSRVLRAGGELILFDGYLPRPLEALQAEEALAVELVARGLAVARLQTVDALLAAARSHGLALAQMQVLDREIMPSLARLEHLTGTVIRWPWFARRALARRPAARSRNVLAGCLMRTTFGMGLLSYREIVLRKESRPTRPDPGIEAIEAIEGRGR